MAQIKIGPEFFAKARNDYSDWKWALVREFFQNSIDCGSSRISLTVSREGENTRLTVENDGDPMTEEIVVNKLLSLGSSGKDFSAGKVGGFGKAKELLYFCHEKYAIETGNLLVVGSGAEYEVKKVKGKGTNGTRSSILIRGDHYRDIILKATFFVQTAGVSPKFVINGTEMDVKLRKGAYRRELMCGKVYTNRQMENLLVVRIGGIPMFTSYTKFRGCVVIELSGTSSDHLTSNRDGLRYDDRCELEAFLSDLTTNKRKALREARTEYHRFDGEKIVCSGMRKQAAAHGVSQASPENEEEAGPQISTAALTTTGAYGHKDVIEHDRIRANALVNEFIIKNETGRTIPAAYRPDHEDFAKYAYRLATIWTRLMVTMHRIFEMDDEFTVGFIFSEEAAAQHEVSSDHGRVYFVNPVKMENGTWTKKFNYSFHAGRESLNELAVFALHELVHGMGYADHDEDYAAKLTYCMAKLMTHYKEVLDCFK